MKLYRVFFAGEPYFLEASSVDDALAGWRYHMAQADPKFDVRTDPLSIRIEHEKPVIRCTAPPTTD